MTDKIISQRDTKYANTKSYQGGLADVLMALKANIFRNLNVATIGEVVSVNKTNNTMQVKILPQLSNEPSKNITCNSLSFPIITKQDETENIEWTSYVNVVATHDLVLVVYTNRNSSQNITQSSMKTAYSSINKESVELHSDKFGIVVGVINKY